MNNKEYHIIRRIDNKVVKTFATEKEVAEYFLDEQSVHKGEGYILKRPYIAGTGYCHPV